MDAADDRSPVTLYATAGSVRRRETILFVVLRYYLLRKPLEDRRNQHGARNGHPDDDCRSGSTQFVIFFFIFFFAPVVFPFSRFCFFFLCARVLVPYVFNAGPSCA